MTSVSHTERNVVGKIYTNSVTLALYRVFKIVIEIYNIL